MHSNGRAMLCHRMLAMVLVHRQSLRLEVSSSRCCSCSCPDDCFVSIKTFELDPKSMMFGKPSSRSDETGSCSFVPDYFVGFVCSRSSLLVIRRRKSKKIDSFIIDVDMSLASMTMLRLFFLSSCRFFFLERSEC